MRKTATLTITAEGRDQGKMFYLTEMSAWQAERWALKAFIALAKSGIDIPDDISSTGLAGIAQLGLKIFSGVSFDDAEPLLEEMLQCIKIIPDPDKPNFMRSDIESDIEEVSTLIKLRAEVFNLHVGFSKPDATSISTATASGKNPQFMRNTKTFPGR